MTPSIENTSYDAKRWVCKKQDLYFLCFNQIWDFCSAIMQSVPYIQRNVTTREKSLIGAIHDQWESSILRLCFAIMLSAPYIHREIWDKQPSSLFGRYNLSFVIRFNIELRPLAFSSLVNLFIAGLVSINMDNIGQDKKGENAFRSEVQFSSGFMQISVYFSTQGDDTTVILDNNNQWSWS